LLQRGCHADRRAFVADGRVHGAADLAGFGQFEQRLLDAADQKPSCDTSCIQSFLDARL
jgi:hypothetical protein